MVGIRGIQVAGPMRGGLCRPSHWTTVRDIGHVESIKKLPGKPPLPQHIRS